MLSANKIALFIQLLIITVRLPAQYDTVFKMPFPQQYRALDSIVDVLAVKEKDTATVLANLSKMETTARQTGNELSLLNAKRIVLYYRFGLATTANDNARMLAVLEEIKKFLATVDEKKYPDLAGLLNIKIGLAYYYSLARYNLAFIYYRKAYDLFKNVSTELFPERQYSQYVIARAYYQFNDFESAIAIGRENELLYKTKNYTSIFNVQMIGLSYMNLKKYDSALDCFRWVMKNYQLALQPEAWKGIAWGSIGNVYFLTGQYDKAMPYLDSGINYTAKNGVQDNTAVFAAHLSSIYLTKGNLPLARKYAEIAYQSVFHVSTPVNEPSRHQFLSNTLLVYQIFSDYYRKAGDLKTALFYLDSASLLKDSLTKWHDVNLKFRGELAMEEEKANQKQHLFDQEQSKSRIIRNALIIFIILVMIVTLLWYSHSRLKARHREQQLMAEKQLAEAELKSAVMQLNEFTKSILEKNELLEKVTLETTRLNEGYQRLQDQQLNISLSPLLAEQSIKRLQESVLLTDTDWNNFMQLFDKVHNGFFIRLKQKLPGLSPAETRFVALSRLKLNNKEMATMLGVTTDAIRQSRSRLKKKLNLSDDTSIEEAAATI